MRERIKHIIDIVTVPNEPTSLVYLVNPSYDHRLFDKLTRIVADKFIFF